jgi:hypothetical protein
MKENAAFNRLFNIAAGEIPKGYTISVHVEHEAGWVELRNEDGDVIDFRTNHEFLDETFLDAIEYAKELTKDIGGLNECTD